MLVAEENGEIAGFATFDTFQNWPAYNYAVEYSVYICKDYRSRGIALDFMTKLIMIAEKQEYAIIVAGIDSSNAASIAIHEKLKFYKAGVIHRAGFTFGRWLDLRFYQRNLKGPSYSTE